MPSAAEVLESRLLLSAGRPQLGGDYRIDGQVAVVEQPGDSLNLINERGESSPGRFLDDTRIVADGWGGLVGHIQQGGIEWENGTRWSVSDIHGEYSINGLPAHVEQAGRSLTFINERGDASRGRWLDATRVIADEWGGLVGHLEANGIVWENGSWWSVPDLHGEYRINGLPAHVEQAGRSLTFINERGDASRGRWLDATRVIADEWEGGLIATFSGGTMNWANGTTWSVPALEGEYAINRLPATVKQTGRALTFINEHGGTSRGRLVNDTQVIAIDWQGGLIGNIDDGDIEWANGSRWDAGGVTTLTSIAEVSPADGEELVSLTREAVVRFSDRIDPDTVDVDSLKVIALGKEVPGRRVVSSTGRFVNFFPDEPWSSSTEIRIQIDGNRILDHTGRPVDADGDGHGGGMLSADFRTLSVTRLPGTNIFGYVRNSYSGEPIVGATIRVDALPEANAVTDENGRFELMDMPAPEFFVHIDGSTATSAPEGFVYPNVGKPFHSTPGQSVRLNHHGEVFDVFLPPMAIDDIQPLSDTGDSQIGFGAAGLSELQAMFPDVDPAMFEKMQVTFAPGAAVDEQGNPSNTAAVIPVPADRIPAPLPPHIDSRLVVSIQAPGATNFDVPAAVTFPNIDGYPPGTKMALYSFNHDAGRFDEIGQGTVSEDGLAIVSDPGVGILAPGWHVPAPPFGCNIGDAPLETSGEQSQQLNSPDDGDAPQQTMSNSTEVIFITNNTVRDVLELEWSADNTVDGDCNELEENPISLERAHVEVQIEIDGSATQFLRATGTESLDTGSHTPFVIVEGSGDSRTLKVKTIAGDGLASSTTNDFLVDQLHGSKITVTETQHSENGDMSTHVTDYYIYKWFNHTSVTVQGGNAVMLSSPTSGFSAFQRTLDGNLGDDFERERPVKHNLPAGFKTEFVLTGAPDDDAFNVEGEFSGRGRATWGFDPDFPLLSEEASREFQTVVEIHAEGTRVGQVLVAGDAVRPTTIEVNREKYEEELFDVVNGMLFAWWTGPDGEPGRMGLDDDGDGEAMSPVDPVTGFKMADGIDNNGDGVIDEDIDELDEYGATGSDDVQEYVYDYGAGAITQIVLSATGKVAEVFDLFNLNATADPDGMPGSGDESTYNPFRQPFQDPADPAKQRFLTEFAGFLPTDKTLPGPDGVLGTRDDEFDADTTSALEDFISNQGEALIEAVEEDFAPINEAGLADAYVVVAGGDGPQDDVDVEMEWQDVVYSNSSGRPIFGSADFDPSGEAIDNLEVVLPASIPDGAKQVALSNWLNPDVENDGRFGVSINIDWTSDVPFAQYVANTVSHELAHTFGINDAYSNGAAGGTAHCDANDRCTPFDIMMNGGASDGNLFFKEQNVTLLQAAMGIQGQSTDQLQDAITQYRHTFNLPDNPNGIREEADIQAVVPEIEVRRDSDYFYGLSPIQDTLAPVAADGPGGATAVAVYEIANRGYAPLTINDVRLNDGTTGFSVDANGVIGTTLDVGETATVTVTFDPASIGLFEDTLIIESDADSVPVFELGLSGEAISETASVSVARIDNNNLGGVGLSEAPRERDGIFEITNRGAQPLTISDIRPDADSAEFAVIGFDGTPVTLATGETLRFGASYDASAPGLQPGRIEIVTDDPDQPLITVGVVGTGLPDTGRPRANVGEDFVHLTVSRPGRRDTSVHAITNPNGRFDFPLSPERSYTIGMFDHETGYVAHGGGMTAPAGMASFVTNSLVFGASVSPDSDYDGLPDDLEGIRGTDPTDADSDDDGVNDFIEVRRGDDPLVGAFPTGVIAKLPIGRATHLTVEDNVAYIAGEFAGSSALTLVDVSDFDQPIVLGRLLLDGDAPINVSFDPRTQTATVASGPGGLHLVDVSDPMLPTLIETIDTDRTIQYVEAYDGVAYFTESVNTELVLRSLDLTSGEELSSLPISNSARVNSMARQGALLYISIFGFNKLMIVDISDEQPVVLGETPDVNTFREFANAQIAVDNGRVLHAGFGLASYLVSNPRFPVILAQPPRQFNTSALALNGSDLALVGVLEGDNAIDVFDVGQSVLRDDLLLRIPNGARPYDIAIAFGIAYVAGEEGLTVINYLPFDAEGTPPTVTMNLADVDIDPETDGIQVIAGKSVGLTAAVTDDVQVRDVELLVNGEVVRRDVSFPFDFSPAARTSDDGATMTLQLRATDTGRNSGLSETIVIDVLPDTVAPQITLITPAGGESMSEEEQRRTVRVKFSEAIDEATVNAGTFELRRNGVPVVPQDIALQFQDTIVQLTYPPFEDGDYEIVFDAASITDRSDNPLGTAPIVSTFTVEPDVTPPMIVTVLPNDGALGVVGTSRVEIRFSEPLETATATTDTIQLRDADGNVIPPIGFQLRSRDRVVRMEFDTLPIGEYEIALDAPSILDLADNPLGTAEITSVFTIVPRRDGTQLLPNRLFPLSEPASQFHPVDLDDDGDQDLLAVNREFSWLINEGDNIFSEALTIPLSISAPRSLAVGDLNNDGLPDAVIAGRTNSSRWDVFAMLSDGVGGYGDPVTLLSHPSYVSSADLADFNDDGNLDIAVGRYSGNIELSILPGNGDGTFGERKTALFDSISHQSVIDLRAVDMNGDGRPEIIWGSSVSASHGTTHTTFVNEDGTFGATQAHSGGGLSFARIFDLLYEDIDADGDRDIIARALPQSASSTAIYVSLNNGDATFQPFNNVLGGVGNLIHLADIDGDGQLDLLMPTGDGFDVRRGNGNGTFGSRTRIEADVISQSVLATADFDGDDDLDIATLRSNEAVLLLANNGDGTFPEQPEYFIGSFPSAALADLDNDGDAEFIAATGFRGTVSITESNGDGSFVDAPQISLGTRSTDIKLVDVNNDGVLDMLALGASNDSYVSVLIADGNGGFKPNRRFAVAFGSVDFVTGDFDGNGTVDVATANENSRTVTVLFGDGTGRLSGRVDIQAGQRPTSIQWFDATGDGTADLVATYEHATESIGVFPGNPDGTFDERIVSTVTDQFTGPSLAVDVNDDGNTDLLVGVPQYDQVIIAESNGDGTFTPTGSLDLPHDPTFLHRADLDGDGIPELLSVNRFHGVSIFTGNADGTYGARTDVPLEGRPTWVTTLDADGDGYVDLAVSESSHDTVVLISGAGDGSFDAAQRLEFGVLDNPQAVAATDLDGDGNFDLIAVNENSRSLSILRGTGNGRFVARTEWPSPVSADAIVAADLDDDGNTDFVISSYESPGLVVMLGDETLGIRETLTFETGASTGNDLALGDINGDGAVDAVTTDTSGHVHVLPGRGDGTFGEPTSFEVGRPYYLDLADLNDDGALDIITLNIFDSYVSVLLGRGDGTFDFERRLDVDQQFQARPRSMAQADIDGDGDVDIVTLNRDGSGTGSPDKSITILANNGDGSFAEATHISATRGGNPSEVLAIVDFDADGSLDLLVGDQNYNGAIEVHRGNGDGTFQPAQVFAAGNSTQRLLLNDLDGDGDLDAVIHNFQAIFPRLNGTFEFDNLRLAGDSIDNPNASKVDAASLERIAEATIEHLSHLGISESERLRLRGIELTIADLPENILGRYANGTIQVDRDAAGWGWFLDESPLDGSEFGLPSDEPASGRVDLLSVLSHEYGHALGHDHDESIGGRFEETLAPGERRMLSEEAFDAVFSNWDHIEPALLTVN